MPRGRTQPREIQCKACFATFVSDRPSSVYCRDPDCIASRNGGGQDDEHVEDVDIDLLAKNRAMRHWTPLYQSPSTAMFLTELREVAYLLPQVDGQPEDIRAAMMRLAKAQGAGARHEAAQKAAAELLRFADRIRPRGNTSIKRGSRAA